MILVYRDNHFDKCLESLKRAGGTGTLAVSRAEALISELALSDGRTTPETCRLTRNGEARIRKCRKYDLGEGYRLICIRLGHHLVLLYAGSHDDCDRWLEHNRGLRPVIAPERLSMLPPDPPQSMSVHDLESEPDHDELPGLQISEGMLRRVFRGFWER